MTDSYGQPSINLASYASGVGVYPGIISVPNDAPLRTSTIQSSLEAANLAGGGVVYVPPGQWTIDQQLIVYGNCALVGAGPRVTRFVGAFADYVIRTNNVGWKASPTQNWVRISNLGIDSGAQSGIDISNALNSVVENIDMRNITDVGIRIGDECHYVRVRDCDLRAQSGSGTVGLLMEEGARSVACYQVRSRTFPVSFRMRGGANAGCSNCLLESCEGASFTTAVDLLDDGSVINSPDIWFCRFETALASIGINISASTLNTNVGPTIWSAPEPVTKFVDNSGDLTIYDFGIGPVARIRTLQGNNAIKIHEGTGDPNGSVVGNMGDQYNNRSGGAGTTLWIKESGTETNTGWVAK